MSSQITSNNTTQLQPLTSDEREWLKKNWGSEFYFLRAYGLSIYKDEDRIEGREILKAFMEDKQEDEEDGGDNVQT